MTQKIELLSPAGTWEALEAAVSAGADAVYLGGSNFGARAFAGNFDHDELARAVNFAHRRGVRIYVTVNTLFSDAETQALADELVFLYTAGADALIVQDWGVVRLARRIIPDMPLHASTQMTITNSAGVRFAAAAGLCRAVPARELTLKALKTVCAQGIEIESFIHGALCMCYSGQCLMSSMIGGRSGNRGRCAQPCRMAYAVTDGHGKQLPAPQYPLSPKDLNTLELIPELADTGVCSFKIEGRMKRPEYVAVVTSAYRRAFDSYLAGKFSVSPRDAERTEQIFTRGFTTAYLKKRPGQSLLSGRPDNRGVKIGKIRSVKNGRALIALTKELHAGDGLEFAGQIGTTADALTVNGKTVTSAPAGSLCEIPVPKGVRGGDVFRTNDKALTDAAARSYAEKRRIPVDATVTASEGGPLTVTFTDRHGICGSASTSFLAETAKSRPLDEATLRAQLGRLGATDYELKKLECHINGALIVPMSELNAARRAAIERLDAARLAHFARPALTTDAAATLRNDAEERDRLTKAFTREKTLLTVWTDAPAAARAACEAGADMIVFGGDSFGPADFDGVLAVCRTFGARAAVSTPRIVSEEELPALEKHLRRAEAAGADEIRVHSTGAWQLARELGLKTPLWADVSLNIANLQNLSFWHEHGARGATLSHEVNMAQIRTLARHSPLPLECAVHGPVELMVSEFPLASVVGADTIALRDRKGAEFPVMTDRSGRTHILNSAPLCALELVPRLTECGIARIRIDARTLSPAETRRVTSLYRAALGGKRVANLPNTTRGHYARGAF